MFSYIVGMGRLLMLQLHRVWIWSRDTMRRIIADIDTDGNGEIDYEDIPGTSILCALQPLSPRNPKTRTITLLLVAIHAR